MVDYDNINYDNLRKVEGVEIIKSLIKENKHLRNVLEIDELEIDGWKGNDKILFTNYKNCIKIVEHKKDKESGKIKTSSHMVEKIKIHNILKIIKSLNTMENIKYRVIIPKIIDYYNYNVSVDAFNGGLNRALYYFPSYYYPCKVLERLNIIEYGQKKLILKTTDNEYDIEEIDYNDIGEEK